MLRRCRRSSPIDFGTLELERLEADPAEETVEEEIGRIASATADLVSVEEDRGAAEGDTLMIDFEGKIDGEAFAGGSAEDYEIELGTGEFIPGFEDQLVGVRAGESRDVEVNFPEDYGAAHLAGKAAVFSVEVKQVQERRATDPDDEMAKRVGFGDLAALRQGVVDRIKGQYADVSRMIVKRNLFDPSGGVARLPFAGEHGYAGVRVDLGRNRATAGRVGRRRRRR